MKYPFLEEEEGDPFHYLISILHDLQVRYKIHYFICYTDTERWMNKNGPFDCLANSAERVAGSTYGGKALHFDFSDNKNSFVY